MKVDHSRGLLITVLGVVVVSPDALLVRLIGSDPLTILFWRGVLSGVAILAGLAVVLGRDFGVQMRRIGWPGLAMAGIFSLGTFAFVFAVTITSAANTLLLSATAPVFAGLMSIVFLGERVPLATWLVIAATAVGIGVIASGSMGGSMGGGAGRAEGDFLALLGALSLAATFTLARARRGVSMVPAMGLAGVLTGLVAAPLAPAIAVPEGAWLWIALLGLVVVPGGFALLATGPRYLPAAEVSLIMLLEALIGPLLVWWVIGEDPGVRTLIGGAIILLALAARNGAALVMGAPRGR